MISFRTTADIASRVDESVLNQGRDIDALRHSVRTDAGWRRLTPRVWRAFELLHQHRGQPVDADRIAAAVWPSREPDADSCRRQVVCDLRQALIGTRWSIRTWRLGGPNYELIAAAVPADADGRPPDALLPAVRQDGVLARERGHD